MSQPGDHLTYDLKASAQDLMNETCTANGAVLCLLEYF